MVHDYICLYIVICAPKCPYVAQMRDICVCILTYIRFICVVVWRYIERARSACKIIYKTLLYSYMSNTFISSHMCTYASVYWHILIYIDMYMSNTFISAYVFYMCLNMSICNYIDTYGRIWALYRHILTHMLDICLYIDIWALYI